jgi:hypothetical protein
MVTEFATFGPQGFTPNTGRLVLANRTRINPILTGLNFPTNIKKSGQKTYYVGSSFDGEIQKLTYY